jgi:hypothetical protein
VTYVRRRQVPNTCACCTVFLLALSSWGAHNKVDDRLGFVASTWVGYQKRVVEPLAQCGDCGV